jgi:hypothetical protein
MGLDMYLTAERFYWHHEEKPRVPEVPKGYEVQTVTCKAAYWRKANQIHAWFVANVQDGVDECETYYVSRDKLQTLVDTCKKALADKDNAGNILPPQSGFFFGSTDLDEWYFADLKDTVEKLEKALTAFGKGWEFSYRASW